MLHDACVQAKSPLVLLAAPADAGSKRCLTCFLWHWSFLLSFAVYMCLLMHAVPSMHQLQMCACIDARTHTHTSTQTGLCKC